MENCYDCRKPTSTGDKIITNILSEEGNYMALVFHKLCYKRATDGGIPVND